MGSINNKQLRDIFIEEVYKEAKNNKDILFLSNEYGAPPLDTFREELSNQFINMAISEQNSISVASGLSIIGKKTFIYSIASFITLRCLEQIKIDVCKMKQPVTIIGVGPCYAYSEDGPTHHATEDIAIMNSLANMRIYSPSDPILTIKLCEKILKDEKNPTYIRIDRGKIAPLYKDDVDISKGFFKFGNSNKIAIVATGIMVQKALEAKSILENKYSINIDVIDLFQIKPITNEFINELSTYSKVITLEEHTLNGGIGSIVLGLVSDNDMDTKVKRLGIEDSMLYDYGKRDTMHKERGIDIDSVVDKVKAIGEKK